jgi:hypothetical protein
MANPGAATTVTTNYTPLNSQQALVLIGVVKGLSVATAGDTPMPLTGQLSAFVPTVVVTTNANVTMATATVGIYTAPAAGGTAVLTTAALTGQTTTAFAYVRAATAVAATVTASPPVLYVNVGTTVATGTVDIYLYGYNVS